MDNTVHVKLETVEDGARSFWQVRLGINAQMNARQVNAVLAFAGFKMWDKNFSQPYKRFGGLRLNFVLPTELGTEPAKGEALYNAVVKALTAAGFTVAPFLG